MRLLVLVGMTVAVVIGCRSSAQPDGDEVAKVDGSVVRGRTQMWTENCIRCHNARSPEYYSDREWQIAMHHMRVRCSITTDEYEAILSFLQSAN